jgi:EAL domain-containing protein (putative c-di-GMP-specific phosphodiesterase class I)/FixJ family two-component response regulator
MSRSRVLIVDDDEQICFVATRALEAIAFCDSAHDVAEATRALHRQSYDLVLVDVGLPGPSGMTLLDELRRHWPQTAAVMLSGFTDLSVAREALDRGAFGYVVKPFRVADLQIQVTAALAGVERSTHAARASARARMVANVSGHLDRGESVACVVVELEHVALLEASCGVDAMARLRECVERRLANFGPVTEVLGALGPVTFAALLALPAELTGSQAARALHRTLAGPIVLDGQRMPIAARVGLALASPGEDADSIVNLAEAAAGAAREGGLPYVVYDGDLRDTVCMQLELMADAATAIHHGQLHVAYQPQHDLTTGTCVGIEALARWHHPTRGDVPASVFVPLAERMDLIEELGARVLQTACIDLAQFRHERAASRLRVSVNVSTTELRDADYPHRVERILSEANLPGSALRLEVTESVALDESDDVRCALAGIQQLGIQLSVDDFGTGYASFDNLTRVPWSELKVDRSLTTQCRDPRGREMLRAILAFGTALDIDVIAEGIEIPEQLDSLRALGCRYGQGFLLGRPQPISAISRRVNRVAA